MEEGGREEYNIIACLPYQRELLLLIDGIGIAYHNACDQLHTLVTGGAYS